MKVLIIQPAPTLFRKIFGCSSEGFAYPFSQYWGNGGGGGGGGKIFFSIFFREKQFFPLKTSKFFFFDLTPSHNLACSNLANLRKGQLRALGSKNLGSPVTTNSFFFFFSFFFPGGGGPDFFLGFSFYFFFFLKEKTYDPEGFICFQRGSCSPTHLGVKYEFVYS